MCVCLCQFVYLCLCVCETVPVGKKLISRSVSPWFLEATERNTIIYAAGDGKEETICIPESSQPSLSNLKHLFLLVIDIKRLISDGFVLDCVEERSSIWRLHSFSRAFLPTYLLVVSPVPTGSSVGLTKCLAHKRCFCISLDVPHLYLFNLWGDHGLSKSFPSSHLSKSTKQPGKVTGWSGASEGQGARLWLPMSFPMVPHTWGGGGSPRDTHPPGPPTPFGLSLIMPRPVLWQAKAAVLKLRSHLLLGSFSKMEMSWVALPAMCPQVVHSAETSKETQVCVFPSHSLLGRGEGQGLGHHNTLPVPSHWRIKKVFVLNLSGFHNFYLNLRYAGNCRRQGVGKGASAVIPIENDSLKYNDLCTNLNGKTEY